MRHFKHYCKLIFSTLVVVLVFACNSIVSYADPLTGAMIGSAIASGFSFPGFAGLSVPSSESVVGDFFVDLVPWSDLVQAAHAYLTIRDLVGSNNVEVELSPELSTAGYDRTVQLNSQYNLTPGSFHSFGSFNALGDYIFDTQIGPNDWQGPVVGYFPSTSVVGWTQNYYVSPQVFLRVGVEQRYPTQFFTQAVIGSVSSSYLLDSNANNAFNSPIYLRYELGYNRLRFWTFINGSYSPLASFAKLSSSGLSVTTASPVLSRDQSTIIDSNNKANKIVIPSSYVQDITYTSGTRILDESTVKKALDAVSDAGFQGDVLSSDYVDPVDPPVPPTSETIADTPYTTLNDTFDEFKEFFGDIYDGITDFQESFGDWVDDVASGWTEVFGDIYSDLHGFKESFGDWVDDVASGWTEIFGDIYSTLSGTIADTLSTISSGVQSLVQSIENADFQFVDAFWKNFLTPFNNLFNTIKSHLSIWHYVVEWLASISSVFTFYLGVFSGAGSGFLLPIYACFAGTVVIAVYKRFGK